MEGCVMNDFASKVLSLLGIDSFVEAEGAASAEAGREMTFTMQEDDIEDPLRGAWTPPEGIEEFMKLNDSCPMESLTKVRRLLGCTVWQEQFGVNMQEGLELLMHSLATGDGWMDESGDGGMAEAETGNGDLPFSLCHSLYSCAAAYRLCIQNGDAKQAAKILPWYARQVLLLRFCCPGVRRDRT
jgi:hypothetical protein